MSDADPVGEAGLQRLRRARPLMRRAVLVPAAAVAVAAVALAGAYATSHRSTAEAPPPAGIPPGKEAPLADTAPTVQGAFPRLEAGPEGTTGQWLGDGASVAVATFKHSYIAFRAYSLRRPRTLTIQPSDGRPLRVRIGTVPSLYVVGPLAEGEATLVPHPGAEVASARDHRQLSVFVSALRTYPQRVAALPGAGFWPVERAQELTFNWLRRNGVIDVYAPAARSGSASLTFVGRSLGEPRTLRARSAGTSLQLSVGTTAHLIALGPFPLTKGRARIVLTPSPGARRYPGDPRQLSVQFTALAAHVSAKGP